MSTSIPPESSSNISTEDALPSKPPPAPPAVPKLTLENPLVSLSQLRSAPSQRDGVPKILENDLRLLGCELIQKAGILLRLPQIAMSTAQILLQRFYFVASMRKYAVRDIAMGAVFLACKVEETPRRIRDIVNVFHYLIQDFRKEPKNEVLDMFGEGFYEMKDALLRSEMHLLKRLAFNVHVQNGYGVMINYLRVLKLLERDDATEIAQKAWNYLNDSLRTIVWVLYQPSAIACAAIFLASREFEISLPSIPVPNSEESVLWCELFETEEKDLYIISAHILSLYRRPLRRDLPVTLVELERFLKRKEGVEELLKKDRIEIDEQQYEIMIQEKIKKEERERLAREEAAKRAREIAAQIAQKPVTQVPAQPSTSISSPGQSSKRHSRSRSPHRSKRYSRSRSRSRGRRDRSRSRSPVRDRDDRRDRYRSGDSHRSRDGRDRYRRDR